MLPLRRSDANWRKELQSSVDNQIVPRLLKSSHAGELNVSQRQIAIELACKIH